MSQNNRLKLHNIFIDILGTKGEKESRVYFQPPSTIKMKYPCICYKRNKTNEIFANDELYKMKKSYTVTVIDADPDSLIPDKIITSLAMCRFDRHYTSDNLNHDVFNVYF